MAEPILVSQWPPRRVVAATLVVVGVATAFALVYVLQTALFLLFVAIVLANAVRPLVGWIERRIGSRPAAVAIVYLTLAIFLMGAVAVGTPLLFDQLAGLVENLPQVYAKLHERLLGIDNAMVARLAARLPAEFPRLTENISGTEAALTTVTQTLAYARLAFRGLLFGLAVILLAFYWSMQEERTLRWLFLLLLAPSRRESSRELIDAIEGKVGAYALGQGIVSLAMGVMAAIIYALIGLPYAIVLGLAAGVLEIIPYFGPILGAVPPLVIALWVDPTKAIWVLVAAVALQQVENYLLVPRVMDRSLGVHPMVTLLAIAGFGSLFGVAGFVIAVPMAAIIQLLFERYLLNRDAGEPAQPEGRDAVSVLRYQAQELVQDVRLLVRDKAEATDGRVDYLEEAIEAIALDLDQELRAAGPETPATAAQGGPS